MDHFDHDFLADVLERLHRLKPDTRPSWGRFTPDRMVAHLVDSVRFSMGKAGDQPDKSSWLSRRVVAPLILRGLVGIPRNVPGLKFNGNGAVCRYDDLETLHAVLEDYLALVQAGELEPKKHPYLGDLGVDGWDRLHTLHFEHHLRQFRL